MMRQSGVKYEWSLDLEPILDQTIWGIYPEFKIEIDSNGKLTPSKWEGKDERLFAQVLINACLDAYLPD